MSRLARPGVVETGPEGAATYTAVFRLTSRAYALSQATGAAGRFQFATIYHAVTAKKNVRLRQVQVALESTSGAAIILADLVHLDGTVAPATGNPAIVPVPVDQRDPACEVTCLALPTTAGTVESAPLATVEWNLGTTGAAPTVNPPLPVAWQTLYQAPLDEQKPLLIRAVTAEGYAVTFDANASVTVKALVAITFTEETFSA
jgi:hypothetical protein